MKKIALYCLFLGAALSANAATCEYGYYLSNGTCKACEFNHYCINDVRYACPKDTTNYAALAEGQILSQELSTWCVRNDNVVYTSCWSASHCNATLHIKTDTGTYMLQCSYDSNRGDYWCDYHLWYEAAAGHYLSGYRFTSHMDWYYGTSPCSNKPDNSYYSGPGTPETNNCPWECNSGYAQPDGTTQCSQLCQGGITQLKLSNSIKYNLYKNQIDEHSVSVIHNGTQCFIRTKQGTADNNIHLMTDTGTIYHLIN